MDNLEEELTAAFIAFGKHFSRSSVIVDGFIIDVDSVNFTATVNIPRNSNGQSIDSFYYKVPLKILRGSQASFVEIPTVTSHCLLTFKDNNLQRPQLFSVDQCDKILMKIGSTTFELNTGKDSDGNDIPSIVFNGGDNGGLVILDKLVQKLNLLEKDINKLKTAFTTWVIFPGDGGAALKTIATDWSSASLTETIDDDIQNSKISQ